MHMYPCPHRQIRTRSCHLANLHGFATCFGREGAHQRRRRLSSPGLRAPRGEPMPLLRIRTKDGTERMQAPDGISLAQLRSLINEQFGIPVAQQALAKSDAMGRQKGVALTTAQDGQPLAALSIANGDLLFLDYNMERENQAHYVEKDPFKTEVKEGELRQQGKAQWTLTDFTDYRSSKEFVLGAPPEPHASACHAPPPRCMRTSGAASVAAHSLATWPLMRVFRAVSRAARRVRADRWARRADLHELCNHDQFSAEARGLALRAVGDGRCDG